MIPIILHLTQDDPKKCSGRKLSRFGLARLVERMDMLPPKALLLDPFCGVALSPADRSTLISRGICAVDCSWESADDVFKALNRRRKMVGRTLPLLMAANPVKFGKWGELSTLEALAASYYILGEKEHAARMMSIYTWGVRFLEVNREPLEAYAACSDGPEVVRVQQEFL
jgi:pre-rRNA-processing protein TSR3